MEMAERLQKDGILVKTSRGKLYTHPAVRIQKQAWAMFLRCAQEFGLTPMAGLRVRANVAPAKPKDEDDDGEFLFGSKGRVVGTIGKKDT
jgi:P27 family predicted phage terminase small subunit